jgi:hypothetical protein
MINHERNLGGGSKALITLAKELKEKGNNIIVVEPFKNGQVYKKLQEEGIKTYVVFFGWWMMPQYWNQILKLMFRGLYFVEPISAKIIERIVKKEDIQLIYSNSSVIDIGEKVSKDTGIKHVWHFREFGDADYRLEYLRGRTKSFDIINKINGKVVFVSKNLRDYYDDIKESNSIVIYDGISEEYLLEKDFLEEKNKIIFLIAGNLQRNKGQMLALKSTKILIDEGCQNFELWVAGQCAATSDSKDYEKELKTFAAENLEKYCKFLGFISDMKSLRRDADIELVCSDREAFGRVTVEAMMSSNPVIASSSGASPELIEEGRTGFIFEEKNTMDLANKMKIFIDNKELLGGMGRYAYEYAKNTFPSSVNTQKIEDIFMDLIR